MAPIETLGELIERAAEAAGSQRKLAALLEVNPSNLIEMKQGKRACSWRIRGKMRAILGEDPTHAFMAAMAEDLETSDNLDEKKAADGFKTIMAAFSNGQEKSPTEQVDGALSWRKRSHPGIDIP
jgi:DNA-binding transcriptional regulator YdaS (Cro superfamily)